MNIRTVTKPRRRRVLASGVAALGALALAGPAAAAPPDLFPFVPSQGELRTANWFVDTSVEGGVYSARYHFATQIVNTGGRFNITPGPASGPPEAPVAGAVQVVDGVPTPLPGTVRLVGRRFSENNYQWGIDGLARYTLAPPTGPAIQSALAPVCREDNAIFAEPGAPAPAPAEFSPRDSTLGGQRAAYANCGPGLDQAATGFSSGISTGWMDVIALSSANTAYFDITGAAPGPGTYTARVSPGGEIEQGGAVGNDADQRPLDIPGVIANPAAGILPAASGQVGVRLSASIREPQVRGRRVSAGSPPDGSGAAPAGPGLRFFLVDPPTAGAVTINESTGQAVYTANPGSAAADGFTYAAEDSRGLRSAPARVFIDPPGSPRRVDLGRPDIARTVLRKTGAFRLGQTRVYRVRIPRAQRSATFSVSWGQGRYVVKLRAPRGRVYTKSVGKAVRLTRARTNRTFRVNNPKAGVWRLVVTRQVGKGRIDRASIRASVLSRG